MSYVHKFFSKYIPTVISTIFTPFCTILVMLPITLCALAPLGNFIGQYLAQFLNWFSSVGGGFAVGLMGAAYSFMVLTGMHGPIVLMAISSLVATGTDTLVFIGGGVSMFACCGMALGAALRLKNKEDKVGGLVGGLYAGFTHVTYHVMISILVLAPLSYTAGGTTNMINGTIASILALVVSTVITYFFGFTKADIEGEEA